MKHIFGLVALLFVSFLQAQVGEVLPPPREVEREHRKEYRQNLRDFKQHLDEQDDFDIVLPPEELVPIRTYSDLDPTNADNWGVRHLLPADIRERIARECKYPGVLKIADTGIEINHRDLQDNRLPGTNYTTSTTIDDEGGHGTHVYGIAASKQFGLMSVLIESGLWKGKSVKVLDKRSGQFSWYANAINTERTEDRALIDRGYAVVWNSSLGGGTRDINYVEDALQKSTDIGVVFVAAAGNENGPVSYPGRSRYSITTASLDQNLTRSSFSNYGSQVTAAMPGRGINSTYIPNRYATLSGTSMASPFLAAVVCIAKAKWGPEKLPNSEATRDYIEAICTDLGDEGFDDYYGAGIAYVTAVLNTDPDDVLDGTPPPPPPPTDPDPEPEPEPAPEKTVSISLDEPIVFRYREQQGNGNSPIQWNVVVLDNFQLQYTGKVQAADAHKIIEDQFTKYFYETGKLLVIPNGETAYEAMKYIPKFFYYFTRDNGYPIKTTGVIGTDERGNTYDIDFDLSQYRQAERLRARVEYNE